MYMQVQGASLPVRIPSTETLHAYGGAAGAEIQLAHPESGLRRLEVEWLPTLNCGPQLPVFDNYAVQRMKGAQLIIT